jgi:hypothetical protein
MKGRPNQATQALGSALNDPKKGVPELPQDIEPECVPKDEKPVDFLSFAALHEVGHSVDDANNFMETRQKIATYGGWISHGSDVDPIAEAVSNALATAAQIIPNAELKAFTLGLITRAAPKDPPPNADVQADAWQKAVKAIRDWYAAAVSMKAWESNAVAKQLEIGERIYQMSYEQDWVSYLAAARRQGLTGYQFRAGGEWFAELYAGYHSGKLQDSHPAVAWLSKLSE